MCYTLPVVAPLPTAMARQRRLYCPNTPHLLQIHLLPEPVSPSVQTLDARAGWLAEEAARLRVAIHGWAMTPLEVLALVTPAAADGLRGLTQGLGRRIAAQRGGGQVFSGRYRSALIEPGAWVIPSLLWLEGLPVRYGLASDAEHWRWSSARAHVGASGLGWLSVHPDYWACGNTPFDRQARYRQWMHEGLAPSQAARIAAAVKGQWALGGPAFLAHVAAAASRPVQPRPVGRPRKSAAADPVN